MIKVLMNENLFNEVKCSLLILGIVILVVIVMTCVFVRREVRK